MVMGSISQLVVYNHVIMCQHSVIHLLELPEHCEFLCFGGASVKLLDICVLIVPWLWGSVEALLGFSQFPMS